MLKEYLERKKGLEKVRWLNTPNAYQKVQLLETGTLDPKKVTKVLPVNNIQWEQEQYKGITVLQWVQDGTSPSPGGTPIKVSSLQFSPAGTDVREFRIKQQQMKDKRNQGIISAGPESHVLDGMTWDEANRIPVSLGAFQTQCHRPVDKRINNTIKNAPSGRQTNEQTYRWTNYLH